MIGLLANWKIILAALAVGIVGGWHAQTIYNGYKADKAKTKVIENLGKAQNDIIRFNGKLDKAARKANDDCFNRAISPDIRMLLVD